MSYHHRLKPNSITLAGSELAPNRFGAHLKLFRSLFGASSEPASVMEFGFYRVDLVEISGGNCSYTRTYIRIIRAPPLVRLATVCLVVSDCSLLQTRTFTDETRHRASTSMYSLTFRVRATKPPQYGRNGTAHAAGASILSPARGVFAGMRSACCVRWAWRITAGLCHAFP